MNRFLLILTAALVACVVACVAVYNITMRTPPEEWIGKQLGLRGDRLEAFTNAHNRYAIHCAEMCVRIKASDQKLATLILSHRTVTPEIEAAIARSDALRNECRRSMLAHFYEVTALLDPAQAEAYLQLVMPLIVNPEMMSREHHHE